MKRESVEVLRVEDRVSKRSERERERERERSERVGMREREIRERESWRELEWESGIYLCSHMEVIGRYTVLLLVSPTVKPVKPLIAPCTRERREEKREEGKIREKRVR